MLVIKSGGQRAGQHLLEQMRRAEIVVALDAQNGGVNRLRQNTKTHAHAGGERLAVSAGINHAVLCAGQGERRCHIFTVVKAQFAIGRVFDQIQRMSSGALEFF